MKKRSSSIPLSWNAASGTSAQQKRRYATPRARSFGL